MLQHQIIMNLDIKQLSLYIMSLSTKPQNPAIMIYRLRCFIFRFMISWCWSIILRLWSLIFRFMTTGFWGFVLRLMIYWLWCFIFGFMISRLRSIIFGLRGFVRFWLFISWLRGFIWFWFFISWLRDCFIGNFRMFVVSIEYREYMRGMVGRIAH